MKKILLPFAALLLWVPASFTPAAASGSRGLTDDHLTRPSSNFDVGMLYYKMIQQPPPLDLWIADTEAYKKLSTSDQQLLLAQELHKLETAFRELNPGGQAVIVRSAVKLKIRAKPGTMRGALGQQVMIIEFPVSGSLYFPYNVGGRNIAVIPNGIELYKQIPITDDEAKMINARIGAEGNSTMVLEIVPRIADGKQPMLMDGVQQWLLFGEIGFIALYNNYIELLWSYQAPSYKVQGQDALLNLRAGAPQIPAKP